MKTMITLSGLIFFGTVAFGQMKSNRAVTDSKASSCKTIIKGKTLPAGKITMSAPKTKSLTTSASNNRNKKVTNKRINKHLSFSADTSNLQLAYDKFGKYICPECNYAQDTAGYCPNDSSVLEYHEYYRIYPKVASRLK